jgi:HAD superfamily hydrolase (TIGR01509 family)
VQRFVLNDQLLCTVRCPRDGMLWLDPRPVPAFYDVLYAEHYYGVPFDDPLFEQASLPAQAPPPQKRQAAGWRMDEIERHSLPGRAPGRLLEVGFGAGEVLAEARARGLTLAICSNWDWDLEPAITETGLEGWFDTLVSSAWAGARKPHPRIYRNLLERAGLAADDVLFVGDTWGPDVEGPWAAGMRPVYLERVGHWPDATKPADTNDVPVERIRDLTGILPLVGRN